MLLDRNASRLVVIDAQTRLAPAIADSEARITNIARLVTGARRLNVPRLFTEQHPKGLGPTVPEIAIEGDPVFAKQTFDATKTPEIAEALQGSETLILTGFETHICVLQTALGLTHQGRQVAVVADAAGSRNPANWQAGLDRLRAEGVEIVTTEMVLFEWLGTAADAAFKDISALIR